MNKIHIKYTRLTHLIAGWRERERERERKKGEREKVRDERKKRRTKRMCGVSLAPLSHSLSLLLSHSLELAKPPVDLRAQPEARKERNE